MNLSLYRHTRMGKIRPLILIPLRKKQKFMEYELKEDIEIFCFYTLDYDF